MDVPRLTKQSEMIIKILTNRMSPDLRKKMLDFVIENVDSQEVNKFLKAKVSLDVSVEEYPNDKARSRARIKRQENVKSLAEGVWKEVTEALCKFVRMSTAAPKKAPALPSSRTVPQGYSVAPLGHVNPRFHSTEAGAAPKTWSLEDLKEGGRRRSKSRGRVRSGRRSRGRARTARRSRGRRTGRRVGTKRRSRRRSR